jgi:hypothetical protein
MEIPFHRGIGLVHPQDAPAPHVFRLTQGGPDTGVRQPSGDGAGQRISEAILLPAGLLVAAGKRGVRLLAPGGRERARPVPLPWRCGVIRRLVL